jgi:hypothetical protein
MSEPNWVPLGVRGGIIDYVGGWSAATPYKPGDVVVYNGIPYLAVNPSTNQAPAVAGVGGIGTTLPASPVDGQEYTLVDSLTLPTYQWRFRYMASITDASKWVFIGGAAKGATVATAESTASTTFVDLATVGPQITLPRAGIYEVEVHARFTSAATGQFGTITVTPGSGVDMTGASLAAANQYGEIGRRMVVTVAAGTIKVQYRAPSGTAITFDMRDLFVRPQRVT